MDLKKIVDGLGSFASVAIAIYKHLKVTGFLLASGFWSWLLVLVFLGMVVKQIS